VPTDDTVTTVAGTTVTIRVLANDTDPDGDRLYLENATAPRRGDVCVNHNGTIDYLADSSPTDYTSSFTYGVTDGDRYRTATVTVNVAGVRPMRPVLQQRLVLEQHSHHAKQRARVSFTNPNSYRMLVLAGSPRKKNPSIQHFVYPGHPFTVTTKERRLQYVTVLAPRSSDAITLVNEGVLNTRNGHLRGHYVGLTLGPGFDKVHTATAAQRAWAHR